MPAARSTIYAGSALTFGGGSNSVGVNFTLDPLAVMQGVIPLFSWTGSSNFISSSSASVSQLHLASVTGLTGTAAITGNYQFLLSNNPLVQAATGLPGSPNQVDLFNPGLPVRRKPFSGTQPAEPGTA